MNADDKQAPHGKFASHEHHDHPTASHAGENHTLAHEGLAPHAHEKGPSKGTALLIRGVIALVVLAIIGLVFLQLSAPTTDPIDDPSTVEIILLLDTQCEFCPQTNTILHKFDESKINYHVTAIDIYSEEGKQLIDEFGLMYAPTALVNVIGLDQNGTIQAALQGQFISNPLEVKKGWVIIPEKFLDKQAKLLTFVKSPTTCEMPPGSIPIRAHLDYGDCKPCIESHLILQTLASKHDSIVIDYTPIMYGRTTLKAIDEAFASNKGAVCAEKLGFLDEYTECNYFNSQFHGNLDINFMKSCILNAGASVNTTNNEFVSCVQDENSGAEQILITNSLDSYKWNPLQYTPSFVIDCKYAFVGQKSVEPILCYFHPELEGCTELLDLIEQANQGNVDANSTNDTNADTNASMSI